MASNLRRGVIGAIGQRALVGRSQRRLGGGGFLAAHIVWFADEFGDISVQSTGVKRRAKAEFRISGMGGDFCVRWMHFYVMPRSFGASA